MIIRLTTSEIRRGAMAGLDRMLHVLEAGRQHTHGTPNLGAWERHIEGALGELAFAKYVGLEWDPHIGQVHLPDVGPYEVRTTSGKDWRGRPQETSLILHQKDNDKALFFLLVGSIGHYDIMGGIRGKNGKVDRWWRSPGPHGRPAYFVPKEILIGPGNFGVGP